jgi:hypothetical protein
MNSHWEANADLTLPEHWIEPTLGHHTPAKRVAPSPQEKVRPEWLPELVFHISQAVKDGRKRAPAVM